jgi:hypothetical protein
VCIARSARCGWRWLAAAFLFSPTDAKRVCPLIRPGQRRASLAQHGGARSGCGTYAGAVDPPGSRGK